MNYSIYITIGLIAVAFGVLWWSGQLVRISNYVAETREELRKCTWPTWDGLTGSTTVVVVSVALLGGFTVLVDFVVAYVLKIIIS